MFCKYCGKQIEDNIKFCPHCGKKLADINMDNVADTLKKVTDTAVNTAKSAGNAIRESANEKIDHEAVKDTLKKATETATNLAQSAKNAANEVTNGQAEKYAEKATETAQGFIGDVKQVAKDKNASNFFTKNKHRNVKIIAVLLIAIFLVGRIFNIGDEGERRARNIVSASGNYKIESVTKVIEKNIGDQTTQIYVVKVMASGEEHSALVDVTSYGKDDFTADMKGLYSESRYDKLDKEIEKYKQIYN